MPGQQEQESYKDEAAVGKWKATLISFMNWVAAP